MLERLLVEQRLGVARAQQPQVAAAQRRRPPRRRRPWTWLYPSHRSIGFESHERRRRAPRRRVAVDRLAGAVRQVRRPDLRAHGGGRARGGRGARLPPQRGGAHAAHRHGARRSASSSPTSRTRSSGRCCAAPRPPRGGPATRSRWSTSRTTPTASAASFEALRAGPADGYMFFTVDPPERLRRARRGDRGRRRPGCRSCASTPSAGPTLALAPPARPRPHADRPPRLASSTPRPSGSAASACWRCSPRPGSSRAATSARAFRFDDAHRAALRAARRGPTARPRSTATTTSWPAASTSPRASSACGSPRTSRSSASTTSPFAQVFEPPLTTIAIDPEELGATAFEVLARPDGRRAPASAAGSCPSSSSSAVDRPAAGLAAATVTVAGPLVRVRSALNSSHTYYAHSYDLPYSLLSPGFSRSPSSVPSRPPRPAPSGGSSWLWTRPPP